MHRGHDHDHHHHGNGGAAGHNHVTPLRAAQWQTPHRPEGHEHGEDHDHREPDLDLVEMAFVEGFATAKDPASFLRLARIPFEAIGADGSKLVLLRVESDAVTDVGALMPQVGGGAMRYDPLPARMVTHRRRLGFVYFDGTQLRNMSLGQVRELTAA
ncbi:MAG TPA: hypothetical protein VE224_17470 [Pseudolabrys sp.]|nr:hypothetical protein [Pseudolabrys sp.]